jgi:hypothetical protein
MLLFRESAYKHVDSLNNKKRIILPISVKSLANYKQRSLFEKILTAI